MATIEVLTRSELESKVLLLGPDRSICPGWCISLASNLVHRDPDIHPAILYLRV